MVDYNDKNQTDKRLDQDKAERTGDSSIAVLVAIIVIVFLAVLGFYLYNRSVPPNTTTVITPTVVTTPATPTEPTNTNNDTQNNTGTQNNSGTTTTPSNTGNTGTGTSY